jgi:hypothetical protein
MTTQANLPRPRNGPEVAIDHPITEDEVRTLSFNRVSWGAVLAGVIGRSRHAADSQSHRHRPRRGILRSDLQCKLDDDEIAWLLFRSEQLLIHWSKSRRIRRTPLLFATT